MAFTDQAALAMHAIFQQRVQVAVARVAATVAFEKSTGDAARDQRRKDLATNTLNNPDAHVNRWAWALAARDNINYGSTDAVLQEAVTKGWDAMAGVPTGSMPLSI